MTHDHVNDHTSEDSGPVEVLYHRRRDPEIMLVKRPVTLPSGHSYDAHTLITGGNTRSVVAVAIRDDHVLLVESLRPSLGERIWELPRGFGEGNPHDAHQAEQDATRELFEETGYETRHASFAGEFILDTTFYPSRMAVVRCDVTASEPVGTPDGEVERHTWFAIDDLPRLKSDGVVRDGASLASLSILGL